MKNKSGIPWFVFNNRDMGKERVSITRERRAIILTVCIGVMFGCLSALTAAYCRPAFVVLVCGHSTIGFFAVMRFIFEYIMRD